MEFDLEPGVYVVAVSGGVDSMALLRLLHHKIAFSEANPFKVVVAHFEHGIRGDSDLDRQLVQQIAHEYGFPFVYARGRLGPHVSEDVARQARYEFLHKARQASGARAIITAHHQDDVLETAILNMLRGTSWRGLTSLRSRQDVKRPLLEIPKERLLTYAHSFGLEWREDSTNQDMTYLRNYIRHKILPQFSGAQRQVLLQHIRHARKVHAQLEVELVNHLHLHPKADELDRRRFIQLPHVVAKEVMATWLRAAGVQDLSSKKLERLIGAAKTYQPGRQTDVDKVYVLSVGRSVLALKPRER